MLMNLGDPLQLNLKTAARVALLIGMMLGGIFGGIMALRPAQGTQEVDVHTRQEKILIDILDASKKTCRAAAHTESARLSCDQK